MKMFNILLTLILGYGIFVVFAYTYFVLPVTINQSSHHNPNYHLCDCSSVHTAEVSEAEAQSLRGRMKREGIKPKKKSKLGPTFLLILVPILPASNKARALIRSTWYRGFKDSKDVMLRFMMGVAGLGQSKVRELHEENSTHGDIIFLDDFTEDVRALTNKTITMIKWASNNINFTYMMKCDEDTYVYVDNAVSELKKRRTTTRLYYGVMAVNTKPILEADNKWRDTTWNLSETYLPYARGGGYILSEDLVLLLAKQSNHLKWHLNEDVSVGSWLVAFDYERRDDDLFCYFSYDQDLHPCRDDYRVAHLFHGYPKFKLKHFFNDLYSQHFRSKLTRHEN